MRLRPHCSQAAMTTFWMNVLWGMGAQLYWERDSGNLELLHRFAGEAQRKRWLAPLLDGEIRSALAASRPRAGFTGRVLAAARKKPLSRRRLALGVAAGTLLALWGSSLYVNSRTVPALSVSVHGGAAFHADSMGALANCKNVYVVDPDVDIFSDEQMDWAMATRFQPDRDLIVMSGMRTLPLDPSLQFNKSVFPPQMKKLVQETRAQYDAAGKGTVAVSTTPAGTTAFPNQNSTGIWLPYGNMARFPNAAKASAASAAAISSSVELWI